MQDTTPKRPRISRRIKVILGLSLALNLAVVGLIAGTALRHGDEKRGGPRSAGFGAYGLPYMIALPQEERRSVIQAVRAGKKGDLPDRAARRALYLETLATLRATPFDAQALSDVVTRQAQTAIRVQQVAQNAWLEVVANMSDAERAAYAEEIEEVLRRGPKSRKRHQ
ncbi:periplasmic heavy metal sensor [uncultured Roseobacter sp.]|uniref:periplasmic heavy metal sensor n=1 Tax=uncultured Roseobacter sp. TaxID=114847 RepID=UPI00260F17A4|nr:periplasmic heavy metal sensor [uncultured Roseobacter sp.]